MEQQIHVSLSTQILKKEGSVARGALIDEQETSDYGALTPWP